MRTLIVGIDSGTQSTTLVMILLQEGLKIDTKLQANPGYRRAKTTSHVARRRQRGAMPGRSRRARASAGTVKAIGIGKPAAWSLCVGRGGEVVRQQELWCDTATGQVQGVREELGGLKAVIKATGNAMLPGYTQQVLAEAEPALSAAGDGVVAADYLNLATGERMMDAGMSGAALDVR